MSLNILTDSDVVLRFGECDNGSFCRAHRLENLRRRVEETQSLFQGSW